MASTHYDMDLARYVVAPDVNGDAATAVMDEVDAAVEGFAATLSKKHEVDVLPLAKVDAAEDPQGGEGNL